VLALPRVDVPPQPEAWRPPLGRRAAPAESLDEAQDPQRQRADVSPRAFRQQLEMQQPALEQEAASSEPEARALLLRHSTESAQVSNGTAAAPVARY
jgi:hypothetical protein